MTTRSATTPVTLRDVAAAARVSVSTASRALTDGRYVSAEKLERIREAAESIGYQPHEGARSLRSSRTMTIGVVSGDLHSPAMLDLIGGMTQAAEERGYSVFIGNAGGKAESYRTLVRRLFERRADALLLMNPDGVAKEVAAFAASGRPVLTLLSTGPDCSHLPFAYSDESEAMRDAIRRLVEFGHRSLAYVMLAGEVQSTRPRFTAELTAEFGLRFSKRTLPAAFEAADLVAFLREVRAQANATAVLLAHAALGALLSAARQLKLEIPADLSVFTFSDSTFARGLTMPEIATIHTDTHRMGHEAIEMLLRALGGEDLPHLTDVALSSWVEAGSVGPAPTTR